MNLLKTIGHGAKSFGRGLVKVGVVFLEVVSWVGAVIAGLLKILD